MNDKEEEAENNSNSLITTTNNNENKKKRRKNNNNKIMYVSNFTTSINDMSSSSSSTSINNSNNKTNSRKRTTPSSVKLNNRKSNTYDNCRNRYVENVLPFWCNDIPTKDEVEDTRAIHAIMMAELFLRLRLNSSQRITARSIFTKYNQLRRTSDIIKSNEENGIGFKSKKRRRNLTQHMYGCEIIPPPQMMVILMDRLSKELSDAPRFGAERRYIDRLGRFVTCDEDEADKNGYKHAGLNNDQMIQNARKLIHANRNPNYQKIIDGAETLITNGVLRYGKVRKVNLGDQYNK